MEERKITCDECEKKVCTNIVGELPLGWHTISNVSITVNRQTRPQNSKRNEHVCSKKCFKAYVSKELEKCKKDIESDIDDSCE